MVITSIFLIYTDIYHCSICQSSSDFFSRLPIRIFSFSATELSKKLGVSQPSVSISVKRGETIAKAEQIKLEED